MLNEIFKNNVLFLLEKKRKTFKELQALLDIEEINLLGMLDGQIMYTVKDLKLLGDFFEIGFQKLLEPQTEKNYDLFDSKDEREKFEEKLTIWQEEKRNETSSLMNIKWEKRREFEPKK